MMTGLLRGQAPIAGGLGGDGLAVRGVPHDRQHCTPTRETCQEIILELLATTDHDERAHADLAAFHARAAAWHSERVALLQARRTRLEAYAFGQGRTQ